MSDFAAAARQIVSKLDSYARWAESRAERIKPFTKIALAHPLLNPYQVQPHMRGWRLRRIDEDLPSG